LISIGHDRAGDHEDEGEEQASGKEDQQALILFHGPAATEEAYNHDADTDDDQQDSGLLQRVGVEARNVEIENLGEVLVDGRPNADPDRANAEQPEDEREDEEEVFEKAVAPFQNAHLCSFVAVALKLIKIVVSC